MKISKLRNVVRLTNPFSASLTARNILRSLKKGSARFSYDTTRANELSIYSGTVTEEDIVLACARGSKDSAKYNLEASMALLEIAAQLNPAKMFCHPIKKGILYAFRQDHALEIKPSLFYPKDGRTQIVWTQYNKGDRYPAYNLRLIATLLKKGYAEHFEDFDVLIVDLGAPEKGAPRKPRIIHSSQIELLSDAEVKAFFEVYLEGVAIVETMGYTATKTSKGADEGSSGQDDLFSKKKLH